MTTVFVFGYVFLVGAAFFWGLLGMSLADDTAPPEASWGTIFLGIVFSVLGVAFLHWATNVETACSTQGMHTIAGECVKLVTGVS